jgi:hypothetical protein
VATCSHMIISLLIGRIFSLLCAALSGIALLALADRRVRVHMQPLLLVAVGHFGLSRNIAWDILRVARRGEGRIACDDSRPLRITLKHLLAAQCYFRRSKSRNLLAPAIAARSAASSAQASAKVAALSGPIRMRRSASTWRSRQM